MSTSYPREELQPSAQRMRDAMEALSLNPTQLAEQIGMKDKYGSSVHNWISARNAPSPQYREPLAQVLGLEVKDLLPEGWDEKKGSAWMRAGITLRKPQGTNEAKRARNREYKRKQRAALNGQKGPAETALETYEKQPPRTQVTPVVTEVLSTSLRNDGTMRIKLDMIVPASRGIVLVQLLHDEISTGDKG